MRVTGGVKRAMMLSMAALGAVACDSPTKPPPAIASVVVGPGTALIESGATLQLGVVVTDVNDKVVTNRPVTWTSANTELATVSSSGLVTALNNRTNVSVSVRVTATVAGVSDDAELLVQPVAAAQLALTPLGAPIAEGQSPTLTFVARDAGGGVLTGRQPFWESRDTSVVQVSASGQLTPVAFIGVSNRTARVVATLGNVRDSVTVSVAPSTLASLEIQPQQPYLRLGHSKRLRVVAITSTGQRITGLPATYSSSNTAVATSTTAGVVTASANTSGSSQIIATYGTAADTVDLTVDACGAAPAGTYPLELRNVGPALSPVVQEAFNCAKARIQAVIRQPISTVTFTTDVNTGDNCFNQTVTAGTTTTGLIIFMRVATIDGVGAVLGRAGPCSVRSTSRLAVLGLMEFDEADLANMANNGTLLPVILHEMLHVIGLGSTWRDPLIPNIYTGDTGDPGFLGERATRACREEHGGVLTCAVQVPVENCVGIPGCGAGTQYGHWRELVFDSELMTGYIDPPRPAFSRMSMSALGDLGYTVDVEQAEDYTMPSPTLRQAGVLNPQNLRLGLQLPAPVLPTQTIDAQGRVRPILR
ncbi:MAG: hypothetical protein C0503_04080 [Gemmatimonas sp.]|nr:hypothetical protein [Gemmatimonas sp.]